MHIIDTLIFIILFRLHVWQGVLPLPTAALVRDHRELLCVAVRNEYQDIKRLESNWLGLFLPIIFRIVVPLLQLCSLLC
jgi:hypothetical protein